jgi:DNA-binding NarL/FixJ family response regulator
MLHTFGCGRTRRQTPSDRFAFPPGRWSRGRGTALSTTTRSRSDSTTAIPGNAEAEDACDYDELLVSGHATDSTTVLVVEPSKIVRQGIRSELAANGASVVAEAVNGTEAIAAAAKYRPQIVLLDSQLPDRSCADVCLAILGEHASASIIVLSTSQQEASVRAALDAGARGYLLKDSEELDLPRTIDRVLAGEKVIDPAAAAAILDSRGEDQPRLTTQELNVLRLVAEGLTNPEIGERLYLSRHTVKEYVSHAMRKLEATNRIEAVRKAAALGLVETVEPAVRSDQERPRGALVYNESGRPARTSELKVPPLKIDRLQAADSD